MGYLVLFGLWYGIAYAFSAIGGGSVGLIMLFLYFAFAWSAPK